MRVVTTSTAPCSTPMRLRVSASVRQCVIATNVGAYTSTQRGERKKKKLAAYLRVLLWMLLLATRGLLVSVLKRRLSDSSER
jgi:hypothetical protein